MPYYCTVPRCTSMAGKAKNVSFHQFPRDEELAQLWNKILKRGKPYTKYSKVCSLHFTPEDYTITSVGKNKGQWRTLRKDALPSQNLPSESPTPYQRKQWGSWSHSAPANVLDPTIQQHVAQAIYMQTMLAMQAAGAAEAPTLNHGNGLLPRPATDAPLPHTSAATDTDAPKAQNERSNSYKCAECTKCFKDPDVYILHKRSHIKNEKENFNLNVTLQANPILANLLKTNTDNPNIYDSNVISVESLLMTALAANMEEYMRNFTSMVKNDDRGASTRDRGSDRDRGSESNSSPRGSYDDRLDLSIRHSMLDRENGQRSGQSYDRSLRSDRGANNLGLSNNDRGHSNDRSSAANNESSNGDVIRDRIIELYRNKDACKKDRNIRYYENDPHNDRGVQNGDVVANYGDRGSVDDDGGDRNDDNYSGDVVLTNGDDDSQGNDGPICDSDFNESIDSNKLVIDEEKV